MSNTSRFLTALGRVIRSLTGERPSASTGAAPDAAAARSSVSTALLSPGQAGPSATVEIDPRRLRDVRPIVAAFMKYLTGPRATASFRQRGMLLVKEAWPAVPGPQDEPFDS